MAAKKKDGGSEIVLPQFEREVIPVCILGTTPLICNRMSEKAKQELLCPSPDKRRSAAARAASLKHDPMEEFRNSPYRDTSNDGPTLITHLACAFKKSMSGAAVDLPGTSRAAMGRLVWVEGERIAIYGVPQMVMSVVRSADMNKTPDIRTRVIIPKWCCHLEISFMKPFLNATTVCKILSFAGLTQGYGDWRAEKGSGNYGSYTIVNATNPEYQAIVKAGGRKAQEKAMEKPVFYDDETAEMYGWFCDEIKRRGVKAAA